jgi:hypothetical protein
MFKTLITTLLLFPLLTYAQKGVTIKMEQLEKPASLIKLTATGRIYQEMMMADADLTAYQVDKNKIALPYNIIARSKGPDLLDDQKKRQSGRQTHCR